MKFRSTGRTGRVRTLVTASVLALTTVGSGVGIAYAYDGPAHAVPAPPTHPTRADQIQNIDQVKTAIKAYYGDRTDPNTVDPVTGAKDLHTFDPDGAYAHELAGIVTGAERYLRTAAHSHKHVSGTRSVLFDVDDTSLNTYNYEIYSNFVYNPGTNGQFVNAGAFPAVPHMVALEKFAESLGYTPIFLTGRPGTQRDATVANLRAVGYDVDASQVYLKDYATDTWLSSCAPSCTTIQYKSLTRQHIEATGHRIVANFGDQYSDLKGGFAQRAYKLPNPMYYLP